MVLNGWQRLWIVLSVLWVAFIALQFSRGTVTVTEVLTYGTAWAVVPPAALYAIGRLAGWVVRGFTDREASKPA
jgi:hypothetical protein